MPSITISEPNYAFVDADNMARGFVQLLKRKNISQSDYCCFSLAELLQNGRHDRVLVYSSAGMDDTVAPWIDDIQMLDGFVLRTGRLTKKGKIVKQQGVDVKLAIDAIQHAYRGNMKSCTIYSGDGDFIPLVDALVESGIFVNVGSFSNPSKGDVAPVLKAKADVYTHLDGHEMFNRCAVRWFGGGVGIENFKLDNFSNGYAKSVEKMEVNGTHFFVSTLNGIRFFFHSKASPENLAQAVRFGSKRQAKLWFQFVWPTLSGVALWDDMP